MPIDYDDVLGGILPFFHIYGQVLTLLLTLREGASVVTTKKFDFVQFLQMIQDDDVSERFRGLERMVFPDHQFFVCCLRSILSPNISEICSLISKY